MPKKQPKPKRGAAKAKREFAPTIKLAGITLRQRWRWLGYRQHVSAWLHAQHASCWMLPKAGDVDTVVNRRAIKGTGCYDPAEETAIVAMRAALAIVENRGFDPAEADSVDVTDLQAVKVTAGNAVHLVNLAPAGAQFPRLVDTFAAGTRLNSASHGQYIATGRYHGIMVHETCEDYCARFGLPWPEWDRISDDDLRQANGDKLTA